MSVQELEVAVSSLTREDLADFQRWFEEFTADAWDRQIEEDMLAGRLDAALQRTDDHRKSGRCTPL